MLQSLPARDSQTGLTHVVIDTPKGSRNKVKFDDALGCFKLSRILPAGAVFPFNFGFIPSTRAEDGDALDVLVVMEEPLQSGTLVTVRLIGVLQATQTKGRQRERNDRLIAVPHTPVNEPSERELSDLREGVLQQVEHFFVSYNAAQQRTFKVTGRKNSKAALRALERGMRAYQSEQEARAGVS